MRVLLATLFVLTLAGIALSQSPKAPTYPQYSIRATAKYHNQNTTYTADYDIAIDHAKNRLKVWTTNGDSSFLMIYNQQWASDKIYYVLPTNPNMTSFACQTYRFDPSSLDSLWTGYDVINTFSKNAEFSGKAIGLNPKNFVEPANAFTNSKLIPTRLVVAYFCDKGHPFSMTFRAGGNVPSDTFKANGFSDQVTDNDFSLLIAEPSECTSSSANAAHVQAFAPMNILLRKKF